MMNEPHTTDSDSVPSAFHQAEQAVRDASVEAGRVVSERSVALVDDASEGIRRYPISCVASALMLGIGVGLLIASGRSTPSFYDRYLHDPLDHASDAISSLGRNSRNLKFW